MSRLGTLKGSSLPDGIIRFIVWKAGCNFQYFNSAVQTKWSFCFPRRAVKCTSSVSLHTSQKESPFAQKKVYFFLFTEKNADLLSHACKQTRQQSSNYVICLYKTTTTHSMTLTEVMTDLQWSFPIKKKRLKEIVKPLHVQNIKEIWKFCTLLKKRKWTGCCRKWEEVDLALLLFTGS